MDNFDGSMSLKRAGRRALVLSALAGAFLAAMLAYAAEPAHAAYTAKVKAGKLTITGDGASDTLVLRLRAGSATILELDVGGDGADFSFNRNTFTAINVDAGRGDDVVRIDQSNGSFPDEAVTMNGGAGEDALLGGSGAETLIGGAGNDVTIGGDADDRLFGGEGDDRFQWNPGDDSDQVEGERGDDLLDFNGSGANETIGVSANGVRVRFTRDVANIVTDLDDVERIAFDAFGGADTITVNDLAGTDVVTVDLDLSVVGGSGDGLVDAVRVLGTGGVDSPSVSSADGGIVFAGLAAQTRVAGGEAHDEVTLATLAGADVINVAFGPALAAPINVDGGEGSDIVRYNGTLGNDELPVFANGVEVTLAPAAAARVDLSAVESLVVLGHGGADTISAVGNLAALIALTFDGGEGDDVLRGGNGADLMLGGTGNDSLDGNQGSDSVFGGDGDDRFQWDPGDGNDTTIDGEGGTDLLDFFGSSANEQIAVSANNALVRISRDIANITLDLAALEHVAVHAFGGADTITVNDLAGSPAQTIDIGLGQLDGSGDGLADTVVVNGSDQADSVAVTRSGSEVLAAGLAAFVRIGGSEAANDTLRIQTLDGDDDVTVASEVNDLITPVVDLGTGE
jgi:Ca2+-binding RTX toxin-like protein